VEAEVGGLLSKFKAIRDLAREVKEEDYPDREVIKSLISEYNSTITLVGSIIRDASKLIHLLPPIYIQGTISEAMISTRAKSILNTIEIRCQGAIGALERIISPLSKEDSDRISSLKVQVKKLSDKLPNIYFEMNMEEAIEECEKGHFLASALISGRVIIYTLSKIPGKEIDDKIKTLIEKEVINKERKDVIELVMKAAKKARNFFSHNIEITPPPSDALSLLGDAVNLLELYIKLHKIMSQT
jgi:predicted nucleic-acid-binding protein